MISSTGVDPSDVRNQTGSFGEALTTHQAKFKTKIQIWKDALTAAANLSGWNLGSRREADLIQNLVEEVLSILNFNSMPLYVAKYPVGIDSQLNFLRLGSPYWTQDEPSIGVYMVGIYGIGGIGKTTLAKALYNKIAHQFEACCFLSKVREASKQFNGLVQLQETLLHEILKEDLKVGNLDKGINILRHRLRSKKVLIALDDVDKLEQLEALVGAHDWFGIGSMIIVTTRNNHLISTHEFDQKHGIRVMNHDHALELFSWHAFKKSHPPSNYLDLSKRATSYCNGHPLALVVLGSFLCTRAEQAYWKIILDEFENSLNKDINDILQISFDGLEEKEKEIFLDISCLLVGEKVDYVKNILNACHLNPDFGILVLMDLSLITIENDKVEMHDLIRQMGYKIVNGESSEPGKRSRLWLEEDILKVFIDNSGTDAVKAIKLELPNLTRLDVDPRAFRKMKNLRLLMVQNARFSTNLKYLPDNLKWIKWHAFSQDSLPSSFITKNLVGLDMQHSRIQNFEKGWKLRNCKFLRQIPILPQCIQRMDATGCESLVRSPDNVLDIISSKQDITLGDFPREFILMNIEIPEWFSHQTISNSIKVSFRHDHNIERTLATSAKFRVDGDSYEGEALISCNIFIGYRLQSSFMRKFAPSTSEYTWLVTTSSPTFSSSLVANDWNDVIVWFEVVKRREVNVTIRSCGVHLTDEVDGIQNDIKGQGVIYTDYDQSVELGSWDVIKSFTQEVSARSDCNAMLHAQNFPVEIDSKIQPLTNFPLHVTCYGVTRISGMEGMAETTLAKSIFDKLVDNSFGREALNDWGGFIEMNKLVFRGGSRSCNTSNRPSSQKYLRVFDGGYKFAHVNDAVDSDGHLNFTRFLRIDDVKGSYMCDWPHMDKLDE